MVQVQKRQYTLEEYLTIEREGGVRYEYHEGELFVMAGGTQPHSAICNNMATRLTIAAEQHGTCYPFNSETKVEIRPKGKYVYPDAGLACPTFEDSQHLAGALTNPTVIVEVVSKESADYDRGEKMRLYFSLPSLQEYVLVSQDEAVVSVFRRRGDLVKIDTYQGLDDAVQLETIAVAIPMEAVYRYVELPTNSADSQES